MKLLKICSALALVVSLNASEIKPFGKFKFGDSFTSIYNNLCAIKSITKITVAERAYPSLKFVDKNKFCSNKSEAINIFEQTISSGSRVADKIRTKGFENLAGVIYLSILADTINIKGVNFRLRILVGTDAKFGDEYTIGAYLKSKSDTITINNKEGKIGQGVKGNKYLLPLSIHRIELIPLDKDSFNANAKEIYKILKNKYKDNFNSLSKDNQKYFDKYSTLNLRGENGTKLEFIDKIKYDSSMLLLNKQYYYNYLKNKPKNLKNDSSGDL